MAAAQAEEIRHDTGTFLNNRSTGISPGEHRLCVMPSQELLYCRLLCCLIQINRDLALVAALRTPEQFMPAFRADVTGFLVTDPLLSTVSAPIRYSSHYNLLANGHRKGIDEFTGEIITLMAAAIALLPRAILYGTQSAENAYVIFR